MDIKCVTEFSELEGISRLQRANLRRLLSPGEMDREGFVTAEYSIEFLQAMHDAEPSIIAKDGDTVVGYALVATREVSARHPLLAFLVDIIDRTVYAGRPLSAVHYVVVGQLCVAKGYRGQGLVQRMYDFYRDALSERYSCCLTDIDEANPRSLKAHLKSGFQVLDTLHYEGSKWHIVLWDWRRPRD